MNMRFNIGLTAADEEAQVCHNIKDATKLQQKVESLQTKMEAMQGEMNRNMEVCGMK